MAKDINEDPKDPVGAGEDTSNTDPADPPSLCTKKITDYQNEPLADDRESAAGAATVACLGYEENQSSVRLRLCRLEDARAVRGEYRAIRNCISTTMAAHAAGVSANVAVYEAKGGELTKNLDAALKALKAVKSQVALVNTLACKLETACNDSCTAEERKIIDKALGKDRFKRDANEIIKKVKGEKDENGLIVTKGLSHHTDDLFDMGVKYAGIQASANVISLKPMAATLLETADGLATNVTEQMTSLDATLTTHQTELDAEVTGLSESLYERHTSDVSSASLEALNVELDEFADGKCEDLDYEASITTLIENCTAVVSTFDVAAGCPPGGEDNKFNTQDATSC